MFRRYCHVQSLIAATPTTPQRYHITALLVIRQVWLTHELMCKGQKQPTAAALWPRKAHITEMTVSRREHPWWVFCVLRPPPSPHPLSQTPAILFHIMNWRVSCVILLVILFYFCCSCGKKYVKEHIPLSAFDSAYTHATSTHASSHTVQLDGQAMHNDCRRYVAVPIHN